MNRPAFGSLLVLCFSLVGCPAPGGEDGPQAPAAKPTQEPKDTAAKRLEGTLRYTELPRTKSTAAYMGVEFELVDAAGAEHVLAPSEAVTHDTLVAQNGKRIAITGTWFEPPAPDPMSSFPTGPDGKPLKRPGRYRVLTLESLGE